METFKKPAEIPYAFQPIYKTKGDEKLFGYEALVRPVDFNTPGEYIKKMQENGQLHQLEFETFYNAISQFSGRKLEGNLFINSFPHEFLTSEELDYIKEIDPDVFKNVYVESLEYGEHIDMIKLLAKFKTLKDRGFHIVVDDFGTGLNSVSTVKALMPCIIKIDCSFIRGCTKTKVARNTVEIIIDCIRSNGAEVLAEGVETYDEFHFLKFLGVDYMQGFYLGVPA